MGPWGYLNRSTRYSTYLEDRWPCAGGLSAVNAFGTQLRDPTELETDPMAVDGIDVDAVVAENGRDPVVSEDQIHYGFGE